MNGDENADDVDSDETTTTPDETTPIAVGQHVRPTSEAYRPGVYRVVGAGEPVALLCLTDGDGRRTFTGRLVTVERETVDTAFEPADDPDEDVDVVIEFQNVVSGMYWTLRGLLPR